MQLEFICRAQDEDLPVVRGVSQLARDFMEAWSDERIAAAVERAHVHGAQSDAMSAVFAAALHERGFTSEKRGLFAAYDVPGLRPDWYLPLGDGDGVIVEVERGGVLTNNRDLLDFYKCHICREANHLFLIAPIRVHGRGWSSVVKRMRSLFTEGIAANVTSVAVFGYGT
jgi:hypothetical protein